MKHAQLLIEYIVIIVLFTNCSASTGTRYGEDDEPNKGNNENRVDLIEDFDITPYKTDIEVERTVVGSNGVIDAWFDYDEFSGENNLTGKKKIIGTRDGYRIVIVSTDILEEANKLRDKLYKQIKRHNVYISFEPPFYKVKLGDFTNLAETNDLKFKLNQLGYTEARIVQETINLYQE